MSLIVLSIPVFFLLIGVELLITRMRGLPYYRFNDAITNLSCGIGSQVSGIFLKVLTFDAYVLIYNASPLKGSIGNNVLWMVLLFLDVDFFYYWFHRLAHEVSIMWGSHVVHHQSEEYNLTVALRQAWVQGAFSWVFYLPLALAGFDPYMFVTIASIQTLYQFWIHTKVIGRMPAWFEYVFNSPSHHRVHHGVNPKYIDKNHAGTLIIWDRVFGTFQEEEEEVVYGITTQPKSWNPLWLNVEYWGDLARSASKARPGDALRMLFLAPGWKPADMGGMLAYSPVSAATFQKYDTSVSPRLNNYIFFQFVILLLGTSAFLFGLKPLEKQVEAHLMDKTVMQQLVAVASVLIVYTVVTIGALFEKKNWVIFAEGLRILLLAAFITILMMKYYPLVYALSGAGLYLLMSSIWFASTIKEITSKE